MKWKNKKVGLSLLVSVMLLSSILGYQHGLSSVPASGPYYLDVPFGTASYYVGKFDNGTTYMIDGDTWQATFWSTNSSAVINACIGNLTTGGKIFIKEGTYDILAPIAIKSNVILQGSNIGTVLRAIANMTAVIINENWGVGPTEFFVIENLAIDGNRGAGFVVNGIDIRNSEAYPRGHAVVREVHIYGCSGDAIYFDYATYSNFYENRIGDFSKPLNLGNGIHLKNMYDSIILGNHVINNNKTGIYYESGYAGLIGNNFVAHQGGVGIEVGVWNLNVVGNNVLENDGGGIYLTYAVGSMVSGNKVGGNGNSGIKVASAEKVIVEGNSVHSNGDVGIVASSSANISITGNLIHHHNTSYGIYLLTSNDAIVSGNKVFDNQDGILLSSFDDAFIFGNHMNNNSRYGLNVFDSACDRTIVKSNFFINNTTPLNNVGTGTVIKGNQGYITENSGTQTCADQEWIAHGLAGIPTIVLVSSGNCTYDSVAIIANYVYSSMNSTHLQANIYWANSTAITDDVILFSWYAEYHP